MLSVSICPKVITLSCFYCSVLYFGLNSHHLYIESLKIYLITVKIELILERMSTLPGCIFHQILWPGVLHCHRCKRLAHLLRVRRKSFRRKSEQKNDWDVSQIFTFPESFAEYFLISKLLRTLVLRTTNFNIIIKFLQNHNKNRRSTNCRILIEIELNEKSPLFCCLVGITSDTRDFRWFEHRLLAIPGQPRSNPGSSSFKFILFVNKDGIKTIKEKKIV